MLATNSLLTCGRPIHAELKRSFMGDMTGRGGEVLSEESYYCMTDITKLVMLGFFSLQLLHSVIVKTLERLLWLVLRIC